MTPIVLGDGLYIISILVEESVVWLALGVTIQLETVFC